MQIQWWPWVKISLLVHNYAWFSEILFTFWCIVVKFYRKKMANKRLHLNLLSGLLSCLQLEKLLGVLFRLRLMEWSSQNKSNSDIIW